MDTRYVPLYRIGDGHRKNFPTPKPAVSTTRSHRAAKGDLVSGMLGHGQVHRILYFAQPEIRSCFRLRSRPLRKTVDGGFEIIRGRKRNGNPDSGSTYRLHPGKTTSKIRGSFTKVYGRWDRASLEPCPRTTRAVAGNDSLWPPRKAVDGWLSQPRGWFLKST